MRAKRARLLCAAGVAAAVVVAVVATAIATSGNNVDVNLEGYQEAPAVSTGARGSFKARIAGGPQRIEYRLTYRGLEGTVQQAHIHFGQKRVNGGISAFLCSNLPSPPPNTKPCPPPPATVTGTIRAADVIGPSAQGIAAGELGELVRAVRLGLAYANVHSSTFPAGEIRAQLRQGRSHR